MKEKYYPNIIKLLYPNVKFEIKDIEKTKDCIFLGLKINHFDFKKMNNISENISGLLSENILVYRF